MEKIKFKEYPNFTCLMVSCILFQGKWSRLDPLRVIARAKHFLFQNQFAMRIFMSLHIYTKVNNLLWIHNYDNKKYKFYKQKHDLIIVTEFSEKHAASIFIAFVDGGTGLLQNK
jgi:hypothetical protein